MIGNSPLSSPWSKILIWGVLPLSLSGIGHNSSDTLPEISLLTLFPKPPQNEVFYLKRKCVFVFRLTDSCSFYRKNAWFYPSPVQRTWASDLEQCLQRQAVRCRRKMNVWTSVSIQAISFHCRWLGFWGSSSLSDHDKLGLFLDAYIPRLWWRPFLVPTRRDAHTQ